MGWGVVFVVSGQFFFVVRWEKIGKGATHLHTYLSISYLNLMDACSHGKSLVARPRSVQPASHLFFRRHSHSFILVPLSSSLSFQLRKEEEEKIFLYRYHVYQFTSPASEPTF